MNRRRRWIGWCGAVALIGCVAGEQREPAEPIASQPMEPSRADSASAVDPPGVDSKARVPGGCDAGCPKADAPMVTPAAFPPADFVPPFEKTAASGDGKWIALGSTSAGDRAAQESPVLVRTVVHPHKTAPFISVTIAAIDLSRLSLHLIPGTDDVDKKAYKGITPGYVPKPDHESLVVVLNGGFQPRHGRWGFQVGDQTIMPPRDNGCTIAIYSDNTVKIRTWPVLAASRDRMAGFRQTPPCLLEQGQVHPELVAGRDKIWAGHNPDIVTRRRSSIGIDKTGTILFYGLGMEASPLLIAEAMRHAGAMDAAELDINWAWTRFLLYGKKKSDGELRVTSTLVPETVHGKTQYVARPSERDFFYLTFRR